MLPPKCKRNRPRRSAIFPRDEYRLLKVLTPSAKKSRTVNNNFKRKRRSPRVATDLTQTSDTDPHVNYSDCDYVVLKELTLSKYVSSIRLVSSWINVPFKASAEQGHARELQ